MSGGADDLSDLPEGTVTAAEYVLGLLDADARRAAEARIGADKAFAEEVAAWWTRLAPLVEDVEERSPPPAVWTRIEAAVAAKPAVVAAPPPPAAGERRARGDARDAGQPRRRGAGGLIAAALAGALAASAATVAVFAWRGVPPETLMGRPAAADAPALMSATLSPAEGGEALYVATLDQERGMIVIAPARILPEAEDRSRELWLIPEGGAPYSLGLLRPGRPSALQMDPRARRMMDAGATLAVSLEPLGGSPGEGPTGPVLGAGALAQVS